MVDLTLHANSYKPNTREDSIVAQWECEQFTVIRHATEHDVVTVGKSGLSADSQLNRVARKDCASGLGANARDVILAVAILVGGTRVDLVREASDAKASSKTVCNDVVGSGVVASSLEDEDLADNTSQMITLEIAADSSSY